MTTENGTASARLRELGITLPAATKPAGAYTTSVRSGNLLFLAGHVCRENGAVLTGKVGSDLDTAAAAQRARSCALELLATIEAACGIDSVARVVKITGFVNCERGFVEQSAVINGASDVFVEVFGEAGRHARSAVGAPSLPLGASVEVEAIVELR